MKYEIDNYPKGNTIRNYEIKDNEIMVTYLDESVVTYPLDCKKRIDEVMHSQALDYTKNKYDRFTTIIFNLAAIAAFSILTIEFGLGTLTCLLYSFVTVYAVIPTSILGLLTYFNYKISKTFVRVLKSFVSEYEDQDKYKLFLENENTLKNYQQTIMQAEKNELAKNKPHFDIDLNNLDKITLNQLKEILTQISRYNDIMNDEIKEDKGPCKIKK